MQPLFHVVYHTLSISAAIVALFQAGSVTNVASEKLASIRARRQANKEELRSTMDVWARNMYTKGVCESRTVAIVRDRFCLGVKVKRGRGGGVGALGVKRG